jgi:hypothetical protein
VTLWNAVCGDNPASRPRAGFGGVTKAVPSSGACLPRLALAHGASLMRPTLATARRKPVPPDTIRANGARDAPVLRKTLTQATASTTVPVAHYEKCELATLPDHANLRRSQPCGITKGDLTPRLEP